MFAAAAIAVGEPNASQLKSGDRAFGDRLVESSPLNPICYEFLSFPSTLLAALGGAIPAGDRAGDELSDAARCCACLGESRR